MPRGSRGPHQVRNPRYSGGGGGGGGGGLGAILGMVAGDPTLESAGVGDEENPNSDNARSLEDAGEEGASGLSDYNFPSSQEVMANNQNFPKPPTVKQPGFWQDLITKGRAGEQASALQNQLAMTQYQNQLQQGLLSNRLKGELGTRTAVANIQGQTRQEAIQKAAELKAQEDRALEEAGLNKLAAEKGFGSWDTYKQILDNPDMMTSGVKGMYSDREKQGFDNAATQAKTAEVLQGDIPYKQAQTDEIRAGIPAKRFLTLPPGNAGVDPVTGQVINNIQPQKEVPDFKGGVVSSTLPSYSGGSFAKIPGGVNSEFVSRGVPPMLARPGGYSQTPALPRFQMPEQPLNPEIQNLPPSYQEYFKNTQPETPNNPPIVPQRAVPINGGIGPYPQPIDPQSAILNFLRRSRVGMPQQFNPYAIQ